MENIFEPVPQSSEAATKAIEMKSEETIKTVHEREDATKSSEDKLKDDSHFDIRQLPVLTDLFKTGNQTRFRLLIKY